MQRVNFLTASFLVCALLLATPLSLGDATANLVNSRFGTALNSNQNGNGRDGGSLLAETEEGNLLVAGFADSRISDTGGIPAKPMMAKFDSSGRLLWQQVYDRTGWSIIAMNASSEEPVILLWYPEPWDWYRLDNTHKSYSPHGLVELWSLKSSGELNENLLKLNHRLREYKAASYSSGFSLLLGESTSEDNRYFSRVHSYHYTWTGKKSGQYAKFNLPNMPRLLLDRNGTLSEGRDDNDIKQSVLSYYSFKSQQSVEIPVEDCNNCKFHDVVQTLDTIEVLLTRGGYRDPDRHTELSKFSLNSGKQISTVDLPELSSLSIVNMHRTRNGDLIISGQDAAATVITRLSNRTRDRIWTKRFSIAPRVPAHIKTLIEMADGRIAATGSANSERSQGDGLLLITDAEGRSLTQLTGCLSDAFTLANLIQRLRTQYRIRLDSSELRGFRYSFSAPDTQTESSCTFPAEPELVEFATKLLKALPPPDSDLQTTKTMVTLRPIPASEETGAFYYVPDGQSADGTPEMLINLTRVKEVATELTHSVLPYLVSLDKNREKYQFKTRQFFANGNMFANSSGLHVFNWQDLALSPLEYVDAMNTIDRGYAKLSDSEKNEIRQSTDGHYFVHLLPGSGSTRRTQLGGIELPGSNVSMLWQWIIGENDMLLPDIEAAEKKLSDALNLVVTQRPAASPKDYIKFLENLYSLVKHLERSPETVELKYTVPSSVARQGLEISRKGLCTSRAGAGLDHNYVATWLENIWQCGASSMP